MSMLRQLLLLLRMRCCVLLLTFRTGQSDRETEFDAMSVPAVGLVRVHVGRRIIRVRVGSREAAVPGCIRGATAAGSHVALV